MVTPLSLAKDALVVAFAIYVVRQCRRPSSVVGRFLASRMNGSHAKLTRWGLSRVQVEPGFRILDVGCGGGRTIETLAAMAPDGEVDGVDYSPASVQVARERNASLISAGRVRIQEASVSSLPFPDGTFDLVTACETHYYWPNLVDDAREVRRVLKPGGTFEIIAETYRGRRNDWLYRPVMRGLLRATYLTPEEHRKALVDAGYHSVDVQVDEARGWISAVATN